MQTLKVLAVDDSNVVLDFVKKVLVPLGYAIETAENGAQALDKYSRLKPDVVTLDLAMPVLDGFETLTKLLKIDRSAKVIVVTASGNRELVDKCLQKGAVGFIEKPFLPDQLTAVITNALTEPLDIHKNTITVFSLAGQKMDASLKTMFDGSVSVRMNSAKIYGGAGSMPAAGEIPKLQAVAQQEPAQDDLLPAGDLRDYLGFLTAVEGANEASVTSFMLKRDLSALLDVAQEDSDEMLLKATELFNVLNNKLLGELGSALHIPLDTGLTTICDPDVEYNGKANGGSKHDTIRAKYVMIYNGKMMPLVVELKAKISRN